MKLFSSLKTGSYVALAALAAGCAADTSLGDDVVEFHFAVMTDFVPVAEAGYASLRLVTWVPEGETAVDCSGGGYQFVRNTNTARPILLGTVTCPVAESYAGRLLIEGSGAYFVTDISVSREDANKTLVLYALNACSDSNKESVCAEACGGLGGCVPANCFGGDDADASQCPANSMCESDADCSPSTIACAASRCEHGACVLRQRPAGETGACSANQYCSTSTGACNGY